MYYTAQYYIVPFINKTAPKTIQSIVLL